MLKQRITVFNPTNSQVGVIQSLDKTRLSIKPTTDNFTIESKVRLGQDFANLKALFPHIKQLRIQSRVGVEPNQLFNYHFSEGTNIYVQKIDDEAEAETEASDTEDNDKATKAEEERRAYINEIYTFLNEFIGWNNTELGWFPTVNAHYYHTPNPATLQGSLLGSLDPSLLRDGTTFEILYDIEDGLQIKQIDTLPQEVVNFDVSDIVDREVGLFLIDEEISSRDDTVLSGLRVVLKANPDKGEDGEDEENVFKTMFHVKPRHRYVSGIHTELVDAGLHPVLSTRFDEEQVNYPFDDDVLECKFYYYLNVDKSLIFDKFQSIPDGGNLVFSFGNTDLELPEYKVREWGNELLLEFDAMPPRELNFTLHTRYQLPNNETAFTRVNNSLPLVFYGCDVKDAVYLPTSPFDNRAEIGGNYELLFTNDTVFYHFTHDKSSQAAIDVPHGTTSYHSSKRLTSFAVGFGLLLIAYYLVKVVFKRKAAAKKLAEKKKK